MDKFSGWFEQNSGYALHRARAKPLAGCCAAAAADGRTVWLPTAGQGEIPLPLFQCPHCGGFYAKRPDGFIRLENLLRCRVTGE